MMSSNANGATVSWFRAVTVSVEIVATGANKPTMSPGSRKERIWRLPFGIVLNGPTVRQDEATTVRRPFDDEVGAPSVCLMLVAQHLPEFRHIMLIKLDEKGQRSL
jgi:hypothetical protein